MSLFEFCSFFSDKIIMPLGGFFICILTGYVWGIDKAAMEISNNGKLKFALKKLFSVTVKYISPALIAVIFISSVASLFQQAG